MPFAAVEFRDAAAQSHKMTGASASTEGGVQSSGVRKSFPNNPQSIFKQWQRNIPLKHPNYKDLLQKKIQYNIFYVCNLSRNNETTTTKNETQKKSIIIIYWVYLCKRVSVQRDFSSVCAVDLGTTNKITYSSISRS